MTPAPGARHQSSKTAAQRYATGYDGAAEAYLRVLDPTLSPVHRRLVELAGAGPGKRVLDLATGTGAVARLAAARGASVIGVDISPRMVQLARSVSPASIRFETVDAAALPFESGSFDAVTCGFGLSHMPDVSQVLAEIRRVLAPGGRLVESSWGETAESDGFSAVLRVLSRHADGAVHSFAGILDEDTWAVPPTGRRVLEEAQLGPVEVLTERLEGTFAGPQEVLEWCLAWPDYGETAAALGSGFESFRLEALDAARQAGLAWWFAINYYVATPAV